MYMYIRASLISQYFYFSGSRSDMGSREHSYTGNIHETPGNSTFPNACGEALLAKREFMARAKASAVMSFDN